MDKEVLKLLKDIKKLLVLQLVKGFKVSSGEIGDAIGVTSRTIRKVATTLKKPRKNSVKK